MINVVFRYDDYSSKSATETELSIIETFKRQEASLTFSVIPFVTAGDVHDPSPQETVPLTGLKADILKKAHAEKTVDVALHGYSHQTNDAREMAEFLGLDHHAQERKIADGKNHLETVIGARITTFVPPWNRYDKTTLTVLQKAEFALLSADHQGPAPDDALLKFLPATSDIVGFADAISYARSGVKSDPVIVVLFHDYDFVEVNPSRGRINHDALSNLLASLRQQKDVRMLSLSGASEFIRDLSVKRFMARRQVPSPVY